MSLSILPVFHLTLVALVAVKAVDVFTAPNWAAGVVVGVAATAALVMLAMLHKATSRRRRAALSCLQGIGTLGLTVAAATLAAPAWQLLAGAGATGVVGRMAPIFVAALALYGVNLWLEASQTAAESSGLQRLARLLAGPRLLLALIVAMLLSAGVLLAMDWVAHNMEAARVVTVRFIERGIIPPITLLLFFWGVLLLLGKQWNIRRLRRALTRWGQGDFGDKHPLAAGIEALATSDEVAVFAQDIGPAAESTALEEGIALLWQRHEESYLFPRYVIWAVPVLGFIGTVLGISLAADGIRRIIGSDGGLSGLSGDLSGAIAPLGIAFDTTLIALSLSVALMLLLSLVQREEERALSTLEWRVRASCREQRAARDRHLA